MDCPHTHTHTHARAHRPKHTHAQQKEYHKSIHLYIICLQSAVMKGHGMTQYYSHNTGYNSPL